MKNIIGKKVNHTKYGVGTIVNVKDDKISIHFDNVDKEHVDFQLPLAFNTSLSTNDKTVADYVELISKLKHTCSLCGVVNSNVRKRNDQLLCDEC